ncbi:MAG: flagellar basal body rod protein FlgB [Candidatus Eisenbacteria bacterium]
MIQKILFGDRSWQEAKGALDASTERQRVIASNIANAQTPGYQAREVAFEEYLQDAGTNSKLRLAHTSPTHLDGSRPSVPLAKTRVRNDGTEGSGVNNVSVERETTEMAENSLHFSALSSFLANKYRAIRDAIRPGA